MIVTQLDIDGRVAQAKPAKLDYFTRTRDDTDVDVVAVFRTSHDNNLFTGEVQIITSIWGYVKIKERTMQHLQTCDLTLPAIRTNTGQLLRANPPTPFSILIDAIWFDVDAASQAKIDADGRSLVGGVHAACHLLLNCLPWVVFCDVAELTCEHVHPSRVRPRPPRVLVCDRRGRTGIMQAAYSRFTEVCMRHGIDSWF